MILNLTPHPIRLYAAEREDGDDALMPHLLREIPPEPVPARLATIELGGGITFELVEFGHAQNLPPKRDGYQYIVSLVVALALADRRSDLLVPYREVRNASGTVIGCRSLAQPV
ncbi:hypothetical protein KVH30_02475 [Streptomyces olivaceus]|uniref:hypothetical protein n=1 Tax=Streptomyces olivaceus TaxID=47716 RepID=UPI001CC93C62|nr:hypothetical protein [Streptomyces olivaceus]MBZ6290439.1 hypothetical protein [Streptomyces olivaceus]MBZ6324391.1 hypothetical protein [Streptomyces olivaceus]